MAYISGHYKYVSGSTNKGKYDYWIHFNNETEENAYYKQNYATEVLKSDVAQALAKFARSAVKTRNSAPASISREEVDEIRRRASVTCNGKTPPTTNSSSTACNPLVSPCLFDLLNDPCETTNLASSMPLLLAQLQREVKYYGAIAKEPRNKPGDPNSNPALHNGTWTWWYDDDGNNGRSGIFCAQKYVIAYSLCTALLLLYKHFLLQFE